MDCSAFRRHHLAYVDDTLPGDLLVAAARHVAECPACARHDTAVRRSLLLARNVCRGREVECSPDFAARLESRLSAALAEERAGRTAGRDGRRPNDDWTPSWWDLTSTQLTAQFSTHVTERLASHRRARQAVAAVAVLAAASAGAALRGTSEARVQGLGGGYIGAAPFGSPFAAASATSLGAASPAPTSNGAAFGAAAAPAGSTADPGEFVGGWVDGAGYDGATLVAYDGAVDAGALVAPAATGVPVWAAAVLAGEVPAALWRSAGASSVELIRDAQ